MGHKVLENYRRTQVLTKQLLAMDLVIPEHKRKECIAYTSETVEEARADYRFCLVALPEAKVFEIPREITTLLLNTDNTVRLERLPYPVVFLETNFSINDIWGEGYKVKS